KHTYCVQWFCRVKPGSSSSRVPRRLSWLLLSLRCPHSKQLAMGAPAPPCVHSHTEQQLEEAETHNSLGCHSHCWISMGLR
ncbi:unnamed protein product, partial [Staurois parvus]